MSDVLDVELGEFRKRIVAAVRLRPAHFGRAERDIVEALEYAAHVFESESRKLLPPPVDSQRAYVVELRYQLALRLRAITDRYGSSAA